MSRRLAKKNLKIKITDLEKEMLSLKTSEKAAGDELSELNQIFQHISDGVVIIDNDYTVIRMNDTFDALSGFSKQEAIGRKCHEIFPGALCHTPGCPMVRISCCVERFEYDANSAETVRKFRVS